MVDSLAAANHSQAFAAGLPLLREICRVATVELRIRPPAAAAASTAGGGGLAATAGSVPLGAIGGPIGIAGLRRLGLPGDQPLHHRGPLWVDPPPADDDDEGLRGSPPVAGSSSCNEQVMLFLRRDLFPRQWLQWLQEQPVCCRAQLLLPPGYEESVHNDPDPLGANRHSRDPAQPVLRLRRLCVRSSARVTEQATTEATMEEAEPAAAQRVTKGLTEIERTAATTVPRSEDATKAEERNLEGPLLIDDALTLIRKQQRRQQDALEQLLQQLKHLSRGVTMQQLVLLASIVDSMDAADAAAAAAAVGDPDTALFTNENSNSASSTAAACTNNGEGVQQQHAQQIERLQKLHEWLGLFPRYGISAGRAVALLAAAGEQQQQDQLQPEAEFIDIKLTFGSLMPFPDEDPGVIAAFSLPYRRGPQQPWTWDLKILEGALHSGQGPSWGPYSIQTVGQRISERQQRLSFLLRQQKIVCKAMYKAWRRYFLALQFCAAQSIFCCSFCTKVHFPDTWAAALCVCTL